MTPRMATQIAYSMSDEDGSMMIQLLDRDGQCFAAAHIPVQGVIALDDYLVDHLYEYEDEIGKVAGHA